MSNQTKTAHKLHSEFSRLPFRATGQASGYRTKYVYDDENRLVQWFLFAEDAAHYTNGALRTDFIYDGVGRLRVRIESYITSPAPSTNPPPEEAVLRELLEGQSPAAPWLVSSETHYIYDGLRVIQERDGSNTPLDSITRGNDLSGSLEGAGGIGGLLARSDGYSGGNWTSHACYFADGNGNITSLLDASQWPVARYRYDAFGNTVYKYGALADANVYRFSSKEIHVNSGMYYYLCRFYEPNLQRWANRDPVQERGGINLYAFVANSPVNFNDPFGESLANNICFLVKWLLGIQRDEIHTNSDDTKLREMQNSPGAEEMRDEFYREGMPDEMPFAYPSWDAARDTLLNPLQWSSTALQVGGFSGTAVNNGDGTATFTINNTAGTESFFYHAIPDIDLTIGPLHMQNVQQTFTWDESIDTHRHR